ncbi:undecaprenyl-phosphate galactose phosphotransferase WbaP [Adonisia turfae]|uniref:Undecaprenyl-phosphate galactose phosphotransferase WbaP n=1 Tax=Adonisia turfae CCMR0081 TaxID=2292702 RepID=A0A6M0RED3_9CYAN|nr:undecaprenyl-phosphate galactose phosphotransferase WbaP [Adonisia turfae]NEZ54618.1 undecaprenyl-phosphate galactose phosphotransferase WbaP [Adonisia turfae CCMR0081]
MTLSQPTKPAIAPLKVHAHPGYMVTALITCDALCLSLAGIISVYVRLWFNGQYEPSLYWELWPFLGLFLLGYGLAGLYPGQGIGPVEELRRLALTTTLLYLTLGSAVFLFRDLELYSRAAFLMAWGLSIILPLLGRYGLRALVAKRSWWGYPVLVLGAGKTGALVIRTLHRQPALGLKPVAVLDDDVNKHGYLEGVPVIGNLAQAPVLAGRDQIPYAIMAMPGVHRDRLLYVAQHYGRAFPHLLIIPDLFGMASLWVAARDLGGVLGLESQQQLLLPGPKLTKSLLDQCLTLIVGLVSFPLIVLIALAIRIDSPGPILYRQTRIGRNGRPFKAWKFRTMVPNAERVLKDYLQSQPELQTHWSKDRKLKYDPRITRLGRWLRRTSLDELPQLWNVLRGEMSLVGPRPIVHDEVKLYKEKFQLYTQVLPGLTGLWQVSGRNNITYQERVNLDAYYVRNWSVWLDIYILIRTIWVVIVGDGAY